VTRVLGRGRSAPISVMKSFDAGEQLLSNGCKSSVGPPCFEPASSSFTYEVAAAAAGEAYLTANFSTYHMDQDLFVSVNGAKEAELPVFYTLGWWNQTQPIAVALVEGKNTLTFTRSSCRDVSVRARPMRLSALSVSHSRSVLCGAFVWARRARNCQNGRFRPGQFKEFFLRAKKPVVPAPPGNYTPTPAPPANANAYIEVPSSTTCAQQGIADVSEKDCSHACLALGFKSTGPRARPDPPGCFVMTTGQYKGNCNFNSNKSATCDPPCTLYGSVVRSLCVRK
jgi:hypothetical protein